MSKNREELVNFLLDMRYRPAKLEGLTETFLIIDKNKLIGVERLLTDAGLEYIKSL